MAIPIAAEDAGDDTLDADASDGDGSDEPADADADADGSMDGDASDDVDAGLDSGTASDGGGADAGDADVETPPDRCAAAPCDDVPLATCDNTGSESFTCACPDGFDGSGVGVTGCVPLLGALSLAPVSLEEPFASTRLSYSALVPPWIESVSLTIEAPAQASVTIDGQPLHVSGASEVALPVGDHDIRVEVSAGGAARSYVVAVRRETAPSYCKADLPHHVQLRIFRGHERRPPRGRVL